MPVAARINITTEYTLEPSGEKVDRMREFLVPLNNSSTITQIAELVQRKEASLMARGEKVAGNSTVEIEFDRDTFKQREETPPGPPGPLGALEPDYLE